MTPNEPKRDDAALLRVGLCQTFTIEWDMEGNTQRVLADIEMAARQGAELIITPECVLNGYAGPGSDGWQARFPDTTEFLDGERVGLVRNLARRYGVEIVLGFAEQASPGRYHNTAVLIGKEGETVSAYRKVHCRDFESAEQDGAFTPGDAFYVCSRPFQEAAFAIGTMICFDREVTESVRCLRALGAEFIACPLATNTFPIAANDTPGMRVNNELITRARAAENEVFIAVVNHAGRFNGGSYIVGPLGDLLYQLGEAPQVHTVEVPLGCVAKQFHGKPYGWMGWGFRRPELYLRYLDSKPQ